MRSLTTYLSEQQTDEIVRISGDLIRSFIAFLADDSISEFSGIGREVIRLDKETEAVINRFRSDPDSFSDETLVAMGSDPQHSHQNPVRVEVRRTAGVDGCSQIASRGLFEPFRSQALEGVLCSELCMDRTVEAKSSGSKSFEFNVKGVSKALPIRHFQNRALQSQGFILAADGDGTLYGKPETSHLPLLSESPAHKPLLDYLAAGGTFLLISGNSLDRVCLRVSKAIPSEFRKNFFVSANGGADLGNITDEGKIEPSSEYRTTVLAEKSLSNDKPRLVYLGDDARKNGNDFEAYEEAGFDNSICVGAEQGAEGFDPSRCLGGFEATTAMTLKYFTDILKAGKAPTADDIARLPAHLKG